MARFARNFFIVLFVLFVIQLFYNYIARCCLNQSSVRDQASFASASL